MMITTMVNFHVVKRFGMCIELDISRIGNVTNIKMCIVYVLVHNFVVPKAAYTSVLRVSALLKAFTKRPSNVFMIEITIAHTQKKEMSVLTPRDQSCEP